MVRPFGFAMFVLISWAIGVPARAQVKAGALRLSIDTGLFNFQAGTFEANAAIDRGKEDVRAWGAGPLADAPGGGLPAYAALAVGYVFQPQIIGEVQLAYGVGRNSTEDYYGKDEERHSAFMLRPAFEAPFNPGSRWVVGGSLGFDVRWNSNGVKSEWDDTDTVRRMRGYGGVFGLSVHAFVNSWCSADIDLVYTELVMRDRWVIEGISDADTRKFRGRTLGLTLGLSAWL